MFCGPHYHTWRPTGDLPICSWDILGALKSCGPFVPLSRATMAAGMATSIPETSAAAGHPGQQGPLSQTNTVFRAFRCSQPRAPIPRREERWSVIAAPCSASPPSGGASIPKSLLSHDKQFSDTVHLLGQSYRTHRPNTGQPRPGTHPQPICSPFQGGQNSRVMVSQCEMCHYEHRQTIFIQSWGLTFIPTYLYQPPKLI